jgi:hypothetical protein
MALMAACYCMGPQNGEPLCPCRMRAFPSFLDPFKPLADFAEAAERKFNRFTILAKHMPHCPSCNNEQVQLIDQNPVPAWWRCRICTHPFTFEPEIT